TATLAQAVERGLVKSGYAVDVIGTSEEAEAALRVGSYAAVLLDLNLPDGDGLQILKGMRQRSDHTPLIILTALGTLDQRVKGLDLGADDYITKPFDIEELEARLRALIRRNAGRLGAVIEAGRLNFDTVARTVTVEGELLSLPRRELSLLETFLNRLGHVVSKEQLIESLSDFNDDLSGGAIELYVSRLRKRLAGAGLSIRTLRGLGYMMEEP
ncbi:MAG: response regulator, partial [Hyphomicrobiaceae bacterium]